MAMANGTDAYTQSEDEEGDAENRHLVHRIRPGDCWRGDEVSLRPRDRRDHPGRGQSEVSNRGDAGQSPG
jgi:hypothetical protein